MMTRHLRHLLVLSLLLAACDDSAPPPAPRRDAGPGGGSDAGAMDAAVPTDGGDAGDVTDDAGSGDAGDGTDAGDFDAGEFDAGDFDAGEFDAGRVFDAGEFDAGDAVDAAFPDPCSLLSPGTVCTAGSCAAGERCLDNGCGEMRCFPAGHPCGSAVDCPSGSSCTSGACVNPGGGCTDSRDCPLGFSCDGGTCVNRRVGCSPSEPCPHGFYCFDELVDSAPFCFRAHDPCTTDAGCVFGGTCVDVAGDGNNVCIISTGPTCMTNSDCPMGVCGSDPERFEASCQAFGPCASDADCNSGFTCSDVWGDGRTECIPAGACTTRTDCPSGAICAVPFMGGATACIDRPL